MSRADLTGSMGQPGVPPPTHLGATNPVQNTQGHLPRTQGDLHMVQSPVAGTSAVSH